MQNLKRVSDSSLITIVLCNLGKGAVYSFDPVGSYQRNSYMAGGSASAMLQPLLDNQVHTMILLPNRAERINLILKEFDDRNVATH